MPPKADVKLPGCPRCRVSCGSPALDGVTGGDDLLGRRSHLRGTDRALASGAHYAAARTIAGLIEKDIGPDVYSPARTARARGVHRWIGP
jgi:hypothetical protein